MKEEMLEKSSVIGRTDADLKKYGEKGTAYIGKVVLSSGENPVLGRKILMDVAKPHLVLICGKRGGGKCVVGDTLITLEDGSVKPIKELENYSGNVFSLSHDYKITKQQKVDFFKRTAPKILRVKMRSGKEIKLTPEHPLMTVDGWKQIQELKVGSRIATPRIIPVFGEGFLKESEIKILAYMIAEGHYKRYATWFSNTDTKIIHDFTSSIIDFDENLIVNLSSKNNHRVVSKNTKFKQRNTLRKWFIELEIYGQTSYDKIIPQQIFTLPKQKISLFLNRLFSCDGTIYFDKNAETWRISYTSASEKLIRQVQHLLLRFEIMSSFREKNNSYKGSDKSFKSFELDLRGKNVEKFLLEIGFFGVKEDRQKQAIEEIKNIKRNENIDTIPKEIWNTYRPKSWAHIGRNLGFAYPKSMRESIHYSPTRAKLLQIAQLDSNELMEKFATSDIFWDEIKGIEEINEETEVFDLTVAEEHNFIANDIIIHNSYSMAVVLEELARQPREIKNRISVITIDTVGIFWTLKIPNSEEKGELSNWDLEPDKTDAQVLVPKGKLDFYKEKKLPVDGSFTIKTSELDDVEWLALFQLTWKDPEGVA
ncbi:MAG: LAGLIDADG family homing endonuclease, partial [archaeon]|nr:LAGLIDADG family homing endonuclease [archaeon]